MVNDNKNISGNSDISFQPNDYVVYPTHGVGKVISIEQNEIAGHSVELVVISFEHEKMTLRVPTFKIKSSGMRHLANDDRLNEALTVLKGRARVKRTMWSRRAQEYETKINSGDLISLAEVIRDLHKGTDNTEQSYSERQLYEMAYERLLREISVSNGIDKAAASERIKEFLAQKAVAA
ncbi:MAG: CarD family transcriptional regulator [Alphaproteobacteria bacterium]|jgi:CarD family transcriptional regulator